MSSIPAATAVWSLVRTPVYHISIRHYRRHAGRYAVSVRGVIAAFLTDPTAGTSIKKPRPKRAGLFYVEVASDGARTRDLRRDSRRSNQHELHPTTDRRNSQ